MARVRTSLPGLDKYDSSPDATPQARWARRYREPADYQEVIAGPGCWCGGDFNHQWPGKASGAPHPRDWPGRVNGHPYRGAGESE